ncbi:bacillithiol biosynthesis cysteine-adding enzyme BshC [Paenibacillus shirakamiensis]|uniref:Putative cysteine ligase BshC n=1 Tax=Paenibacillus shirakamiensis TaxID=1265935 RepID=A0ABS4JE32_9BACL|nr:bacillithiol biosynthesis cysteine-adding enzyme BshC [Paenibacillus shirakamiensis]MBP1999211.1 bacillithiol biosynthesis cysteine-adding enzyme BshC [Paenibacillus shirakamiensis]
MNLISEPLASQQPLAEALISDFDAVRHLYTGSALETESWTARAQWLHEHEDQRINRKALVEKLRLYNQQHNPASEVEDALDLLERKETLVISGGQQSGLFTGPLLVIYKAMTIIQAARQASHELSIPVVPIFWIAGEDHDWEEVNHAYFLDSALDVERIRIVKDQLNKNSVGYTSVEKSEWRSALQQLADLLPDSEHKQGLLHQLEDAVAKSATLTDCFAKLMGLWFGKYGLILLDSSDPELRQLESEVFEQIIIKNDELEVAYKKSAAQLQEQGIDPQADVAEDAANLFYIYEGQRLLLFKKEGRFEDRKGIISLSKEELIEESQLHPERFSNNVLTRPLMQDMLLPVLGTVLGDGEIAYWALTGQAFHVMGLQMPLLLPRMSFTIMEPKVQRHMKQYGFSFVEARQHFKELRQTWLTSQEPVPIDTRFAELKGDIEQLYTPLIQELGSMEKGLSRIGDANLHRILQQVDYLRDKSAQAMEHKHEAVLRQWDRVQQSLFPQDSLQERVYNVFTYLNRYGPNWIDSMMELPYLTAIEHRIIEA